MRGWMVAVVAAAVLAAVAGLLVIVVVAGSGGMTPLVELEAGDCFDLPEQEPRDGTIEEVDVIDCAEPHLAEVVFVGSLDDGDEPYPSDDELFAAVELACRESGVVVSDDFGLLPIAPTPELWESFDGRYLCVAVPFGGRPVTGSAGSG